MIKNVIFDVGNVLIAFHPEHEMRQLGIPEDKIEPMAEATYLSPWWVELDRGVIPEEEIIAHMKEEHPELAQDIDMFFTEGRKGLVDSYDYAAGWLKGLQEKGYKTYLLSNYPENYFELHMKKKFTFMPYIDGKVVSGAVKMIKPDAEIYEYLLQKFSLKPEECVFIDDRPENVETAEKLGIHGIIFTDYEQSRVELQHIIEKNKV